MAEKSEKELVQHKQIDVKVERPQVEKPHDEQPRSIKGVAHPSKTT